MRILHTADWHLGDRLGRIDRTDDLRRGVERVAEYCQQEKVDVLLVAGDLFSEMSRPDHLRGAIEHLQDVFLPFLLSGGTIVALTGNHDNETFCQTLHNAMTMAAPAGDRIGDVRPCGRLHLAAAPACFRLADRAGQEVQFLLMPYPTPSRYLHDTPAQRYGSLEEKNRHLGDAFVTKLRQLQDDPAYRRDCPTVLSAHVHVHGVSLAGLFRMTEQESIVLGDGDLPHGMAYVALGHIHQPQALGGLPHVRYCGSIERLDLGEQRDAKGVVVFDVGPDGLQGAPRVLPLDATPIYEVDIADPAVDLPQLRDRYPDADRALVKYHLTYRTGTDNLEAILKELDGIFPRWYARDWRDANALGPTLAGPDAVTPHQGFAETVRAYLQTELVNHADDERDAVLRLAEELLAEEGA